MPDPFSCQLFINICGKVANATIEFDHVRIRIKGLGNQFRLLAFVGPATEHPPEPRGDDFIVESERNVLIVYPIPAHAGIVFLLPIDVVPSYAFNVPL